MTELKRILEGFEGINLSEMEAVELMNRRDSKFVFRREQLVSFLELIQPYYRVLDVSDNRLISYRNIYYDTNDLNCYRQHHNGKKNRFKFRHRQYVESDISFFEVKHKNNQSRTDKTRIREPEFRPEISPAAVALIEESSPVEANELFESLRINFTRITVVNKDFSDRCTIDLNLETAANGNSTSHDQIVIAEIKQERYSRSSPFMAALKQLGIRPMRISKYCLGILDTREDVKRNRFKVKLRKIHRILNPSYD